MTSVFFFFFVTNGIRANPVLMCGLEHMNPNEDVRDLSEGDYDVSKFDKCV